MMRPMLLTLITAICLLAPARTAPALDMDPMWLGTPFMEGWVPEDVSVIRGVLVNDGFPLDSRWREAARYWQFAILRINSDKYGSDIADEPRFAPLKQPGVNIKATAVAHGLSELARRTGHPEIEHVPVVSFGFSRYSGPAASYQAAFPERALAFMNGNGGGGDPGPNDPQGQLLWRQTPSLGLQSEWENIFSGGDKTQLLDSWWRRPDGNLTAAAIHWRVYHSPQTFADLGIPFVNEVIEARIPDDWDPRQGPAELKPLREQEGWLGSHRGWRVPIEQVLQTDNENAHIAPYADFEHDRQRASWLVSEDLAWVWRAFSSRYPQARIVAPGHSNIVLHQHSGPPPVGHLETGIRAGEPFRAAAQLHAPNVVEVAFFANDTPLGETETFHDGQTALGNTTDALAEVEAVIEEPGIYGLMARYTTADGTIGWTRPMPLLVWPSPAGQ